jgi:hypothetical protein
MPIEVRLVTKNGRSGDLSQGHWRIALRDEFACMIQAHQNQLMMRRIAGKLPKHQRKMAAAHPRHGSKFLQGDILRKIGFKALNSTPNAWWDGRTIPGRHG